MKSEKIHAGQAISSLLDKAGLTRHAASIKMGVNTSRIYRLTKQKQINTSTLHHILWLIGADYSDYEKILDEQATKAQAERA